MLTTLLTAFLLTQAPSAPTPVPKDASPSGAATPPPLSELHRAQVDAHLAHLRVLQLEVQLREQALTEERARIEAAVAQAHPQWRIDWAKGVLVPTEPPK